MVIEECNSSAHTPHQQITSSQLELELGEPKVELRGDDKLVLLSRKYIIWKYLKKDHWLELVRTEGDFRRGYKVHGPNEFKQSDWLKALNWSLQGF